MLSGVSFSRRTVKRLISPDGTEKTFQRWRSAGPGSFALVDGVIAQPGLPGNIDGISVPVGPHFVFYYAAEAFDDFTLRLQFRLSGPIGSTGRTGRQFGNFSPVPCATFEGAGPAPGDVGVRLSAGGREIARFLARTGFLQAGASGAPADRPSVLTEIGPFAAEARAGPAPKRLISLIE
jgi:hypothetical protein